jgi:hypothetical protein
VEVATDAASLMRWIVDFELLQRWLRADRIDVLRPGEADGTGCEFRADFGPGRGSPGTLCGKHVSVGSDELVRVWRLSEAVDPAGAYERTVSYRAASADAGVVLHCRIDTSIPGMSSRLLSSARQADEQSASHAFDRLAQLAVGGRLNRRARWLSGVVSTPL